MTTSTIRRSRLRLLGTGFERPLHLALFAFTSSALFFLVFWRMPLLLNEDNVRLHGAPGEIYNYLKGVTRNGTRMHLACIVPVGLSVPWQFVPSIRRNYPALHRTLGYFITALLVPLILSAFSIAPNTLGGTPDIQGGVYALGIVVSYALYRGVTSMRGPQKNIQEHRRWMLRAMVWMSTITTQRCVLIGLMLLVSPSVGGTDFYTLWNCAEAQFTFEEASELFLKAYPACVGSPDGLAIVRTDFFGSALEFASSARLTFGTSIWVGLAIHIVAVEYYLIWEADRKKRLASPSAQLAALVDAPRDQKNGSALGLTTSS